MIQNHSERPLRGKRILVTRAGAQARDLVEQIVALGGEAVEFPTIKIEPPEDFAAFDRVIEKIESYDWLIFTSVNAIEPFLSRLYRAGKTAASLQALKIGAIGPETARRLQAAGLRVDLVPRRYQAEGILEAMTPQEMKNKRVLIPRAGEAREVLPETLRTWGASVDVVVAYRTALTEADIGALASRLRQGGIDVITFTSSSTVKNFIRLLGGGKLTEVAGKSAIACIGPITAQTVTQLGGRSEIVATEFTTAGLTRAIIEHFRARSSLSTKSSAAS